LKWPVSRSSIPYPLLEGKLVFEMVIEASGEVAQVKLLSTELADETLTRKILSRIRMIRFEQQNVVSTRVNDSFDFLPYG
jgi:periplasmic protein TonB